MALAAFPCAPNKLIIFLGEVTLDGDRRICSLGDMGELDELIVSVDEENRRVVYSIRGAPISLTHHNASMQALPDGNGGTRFVWVTDLKPTRWPGSSTSSSTRGSSSIKEALRS